eukprot:CAMPEP_0114539540 /NCGR_PEP_ID=MMETSP0114-20121206/290_1 /TAXON_ID=31324 /ORGANISM="Goniomonas sp, Strain m" /LENGTH=260 /DNA_ID=CAMNT_0001723645 /DNA_START=52 /DNA_END=834 /DNA_ORIENTATION=+
MGHIRPKSKPTEHVPAPPTTQSQKFASPRKVSTHSDKVGSLSPLKESNAVVSTNAMNSSSPRDKRARAAITSPGSSKPPLPSPAKISVSEMAPLSPDKPGLGAFAARDAADRPARQGSNSDLLLAVGLLGSVRLHRCENCFTSFTPRCVPKCGHVPNTCPRCFSREVGKLIAAGRYDVSCLTCSRELDEAELKHIVENEIKLPEIVQKFNQECKDRNRAMWLGHHSNERAKVRRLRRVHSMSSVVGSSAATSAGPVGWQI